MSAIEHPFIQKLLNRHQSTNHWLCIGLDPDPTKLPTPFNPTEVDTETFLLQTIENTQELATAYKPNISFFESMGIKGLQILEKILAQIPKEIPIILDAKRGDIGNTAMMQARYIFDYFDADAITINPYMGTDNVQPFLDYKDKYSFVLALTSNPGAQDFEKRLMDDGKSLYQHVIKKSLQWNEGANNLGLVVGATQDELTLARDIAKDLLFLMPGVGAQGGSYSECVQNGQSKGLNNAILINASRAVLYAGDDDTYLAAQRSAIHTLINN